MSEWHKGYHTGIAVVVVSRLIVDIVIGEYKYWKIKTDLRQIKKYQPRKDT